MIAQLIMSPLALSQTCASDKTAREKGTGAALDKERGRNAQLAVGYSIDDDFHNWFDSIGYGECDFTKYSIFVDPRTTFQSTNQI